MKQAIPVIEIMSKSPVTVAPQTTAVEAAAIMKQKDLGSLLVVTDGKPVGIVTERDLVTKVVALDAHASEVPVASMMTSPVVAIGPYQEILEAARMMSELNIRRLAVVDDDHLVGLVTENDIIKVWPALIEIVRERAAIATPVEGAGVGYCEGCSMFSDRLTLHDGQLLCPDCLEG